MYKPQSMLPSINPQKNKNSENSAHPHPSSLKIYHKIQATTVSGIINPNLNLKNPVNPSDSKLDKKSLRYTQFPPTKAKWKSLITPISSNPRKK